MSNPQARVAVYSGMFDPVHLGHLDIIERGRRVFERLIVGVGVNPEKVPLFSVDERVHLLQEVVKPFGNVQIQPFSGLAVRFVRQVGAGVMIRGLRTVSDMEYEFSMSLTNQALDPAIETVFLLSKVDYSHLSSTLIRQIAAFGGDLGKFLPPAIVAQVEAKLKQRKG
jgi:pantetheine-phosphate adenylyltransferase